MKWWDIIKSSREAYKTFLQEVGPDVDLSTIPVRKEEEPHIVTDNFTIFGKGSSLVILSDTFKGETEFIQGIFNEEYPEREKQILTYIYSQGRTDGNITWDTKYQILDESLSRAKERLKEFFMRVALEEVRPHLMDMRSNGEQIDLGLITDFSISVADLWDHLPKKNNQELLRKYTDYINSLGDFYSFVGRQGMYQIAMSIIADVMVKNTLEFNDYFRNYAGNKEQIEGVLKDIISPKLRSDITEDGEILELSQPEINTKKMGRLALIILLGEE